MWPFGKKKYTYKEADEMVQQALRAQRMQHELVLEHKERAVSRMIDNLKREGEQLAAARRNFEETKSKYILEELKNILRIIK